MIYISRNNYTFGRDLYGLRIGLGKKDRLNFALNILKVEDNINTVDQSLNNTIIDIPYNMSPFSEYNSSECIDINHDSLCDTFDLNIDYDSEGNLIPGNSSSTYDEIANEYPCDEYYYSKSKETIYISTYECASEDNWCNIGEIYNHIQNVWEVKVSDEGDNLDCYL